MASVVLDASALLAYFQDEPGAVLVEDALAAGAAMSAANWAEVLSKLADAGMDPAEFSRELHESGFLGGNLRIETLDAAAALAVAAWRRATRALGLSLGDRACLALAARLGVPVLTVDAAWSKLEPKLDVRLVR